MLGKKTHKGKTTNMVNAIFSRACVNPDYVTATRAGVYDYGRNGLATLN